MNGLIISPGTEELCMLGFEKPEQNIIPIPVATDNQGRMILSPDLNIQVQSNWVDIRPLQDLLYQPYHTANRSSNTNAVAAVITSMKFARLSVQASANTGIVAYYNGRA